MINEPDSAFINARFAWRAGARLRATRRRLMRNTYGDQWSDLVKTSDGRVLTEYERAVGSGMSPMTNNLLRALVKTVVGRFRYNVSQENHSSSADFQKFSVENQLDELDSRAIEEFLISGCAIQKLTCERRSSGLGVWADNVSPDSFFVSPYLDPRGSDIRLIGMTSDMPLSEVKLRFGHGSKRRCREIERIYTDSVHAPVFGAPLSLGEGRSEPDFLRPSDPAMCRVIEVWSFDIDLSEPGDDPHWHCRFFTPSGKLLDETRSLLPGGSHPFIVKMYPLTGGAVHPFIEDLVDQQKHINKLITTIDHVLANSAKGVLLLPTDCLPPGTDYVMAAGIWNKPGGVLPINPRARQLPVEISSSGHSEGAAKLLESELKMFQQISGVTSALQGRAEGSNTSASLFESQVYQSAIALLDVYETFNSFRSERNRAALEFINVFSQ